MIQHENGFGALLTERFSARSFRQDRVPHDTLAGILRTAQRTPSWCNTQPWQTILLSGDALGAFRDALYGVGQHDEPDFDVDPPEYEGIALARRREAGWGLYSAVGITKGDRAASRQQAAENFRFFGAPHVAVITSDAKQGGYGLIDCGGYVNNLVLAAREEGVDTIVQAAVVSRGGFVRRHLDIPSDRTLVCGVSLGYAVTDHPANRFRTSRAAISDVVEFRE